MRYQEYDFVFVSQVPVFYKVNLYNSLSDKYKVFVIFLANDTVEKRSSDFFSLDDLKFDYLMLSNNYLQNRDKIKTIIRIYSILRRIEYRQLVLCAWDYIETWVLSWLFPKSKNAFVLESSIIESKLTGIKKILKKIFLNRIATVYASGSPHVELLCALEYKGNITKTRGVGLINKKNKLRLNNQPNKKADYFLFIGRLVREKNIALLLDYFRMHSDLKLKIIGEGPLGDILKKEASANIEFLGSVSNDKISNYMDNAIALVLPSISEPWGLVVEEALLNSCHVLISKNCGVVDLVQDLVPAQIFDPYDIKDFDRAITKILTVYGSDQRMTGGPMLIEEKDLEQVSSYDLVATRNED